MNRRTWIPALAAVAGACDYGWYEPDGPDAWDALAPAVVGDALVVRLPQSGRAVLLRPGAAPEPLDLGVRRVEGLVVAPDGATLLATTTEVQCEDAEGFGYVFVDDCPYDDRRVEQHTEVLQPEVREASYATGTWYDAFTFSPDARFAVAPVRPDADVTGGGLVSLDAVLVLDLVAGKRWEVPVGFRATRLVFTSDDAGATDGMVVLSRSEVALVDLSADVPLPGTVYPLALDASTTIDPADVVVTPDDAYALISVAGSSDLYVLDLVDPSINLVALGSAPRAMVVDAERDQTILAYDRPYVEVLDHQRFDLVRVPLGDHVGHVELLGDAALLWSSNGGRDVVRLDLTTLQTEAVRVNWAPERLEVAPDASFAVALSSSAGGRLEVLDLRPDQNGELPSRSRPFGLDGVAEDVAFAGEGADLRVLLLQQGVDALFSLALPTYAVAALELDAPPLRLGTLDDGTFWITHDDPLGLVSFLDASGEVSTVADFAHHGLYEPQRLASDEEVTP